MYAEYEENSPQDLAIESLAKEIDVPIDDVARLYERELARLGIGASIAHFVPIFAIRNVREMLHRRRTAR